MPKRNQKPVTIQDPSPHTSFVSQTGFKIMYITILLSMWALLHTLNLVDNAGAAWNIILRLHAIITFVFFHWIKGAPETGMLEEEQLQTQTFWEQIDAGYVGTPARRFLITMPFAVFFITLFYNVQHDDVGTLLINAAFTLLIVVAKHEALFGVRIFGINKG